MFWNEAEAQKEAEESLQAADREKGQGLSECMLWTPAVPPVA